MTTEIIASEKAVDQEVKRISNAKRFLRYFLPEKRL